MTLQETADTLIKWCNSCDKFEQVELLDSLVERFVIHPFRSHIELNHQVTRILVAIRDRSFSLREEPKYTTSLN